MTKTKLTGAVLFGIILNAHTVQAQDFSHDYNLGGISVTQVDSSIEDERAGFFPIILGVGIAAALAGVAVAVEHANAPQLPRFEQPPQIIGGQAMDEPPSAPVTPASPSGGSYISKTLRGTGFMVNSWGAAANFRQALKPGDRNNLERLGSAARGAAAAGAAFSNLRDLPNAPSLNVAGGAFKAALTKSPADIGCAAVAAGAYGLDCFLANRRIGGRDLRPVRPYIGGISTCVAAFCNYLVDVDNGVFQKPSYFDKWTKPIGGKWADVVKEGGS